MCSLEERLDLGLLGNLFAALAVGALDRGVGAGLEQLLDGVGVVLVQRVEQRRVANVALGVDLSRKRAGEKHQLFVVSRRATYLGAFAHEIANDLDMSKVGRLLNGRAAAHAADAVSCGLAHTNANTNANKHTSKHIGAAAYPASFAFTSAPASTAAFTLSRSPVFNAHAKSSLTAPFTSASPPADAAATHF